MTFAVNQVPPAAGGTVSVTAPITGNGSSGSPLAVSAATSSTPGVVQVDNTTITAAAGIISVGAIAASAVTSGTLGVARGGTGAAAFTLGSIVFAGSSGVYTQDNANFFWNATNHRLGIGTTSPNSQIDVSAATPETRLTCSGTTYYARKTFSAMNDTLTQYNQAIKLPSTTPTLVAHTISSNGASGGPTPAINTTTANLIVVSVAGVGNYTALNLSDSKGNTWTAGPGAWSGSNPSNRIFYCINPTVGIGHTFSSSSSASNIAVQAWKLSGTGIAVDQQTAASGTSATIQPGSVTPNFNNELVVASVGANNGSSLTINSGFTISDGTISSTSYGNALAYLAQTMAAAVNPTWSNSASVNAAAILTFTAAYTGTVNEVTVFSSSDGILASESSINEFGDTNGSTVLNYGSNSYFAIVLSGTTDVFHVTGTGLIGIGGVTTPTAAIQLPAGTTTVPPLKITAGTNVTSPADGFVEYNGSHFYATVGTNRYQLDQQLSAGNAVYGLFSHFADASNVTTGNTILYTDALAAGLLATNGNAVECEYSGTFATSVSTKQVRLYFGPLGTASDTLVFDSGALAVTANGMWDLWVKVVRESASVVRIEATCTFGGTGVSVFAQPTYTRITGLTLANAQSLTLTGTSSAASADVTASLAKAMFIP
jgi:hypothetical protein